MESHAVIVEIDENCLLAKAGVEVGDVLDELCDKHIHEDSHGSVSNEEKGRGECAMGKFNV